jgi:hypothetical protein
LTFCYNLDHWSAENTYTILKHVANKIFDACIIFLNKTNGQSCKKKSIATKYSDVEGVLIIIHLNLYILHTQLKLNMYVKETNRCKFWNGGRFVSRHLEVVAVKMANTPWKPNLSKTRQIKEKKKTKNYRSSLSAGNIYSLARIYILDEPWCVIHVRSDKTTGRNHGATLLAWPRWIGHPHLLHVSNETNLTRRD